MYRDYPRYSQGQQPLRISPERSSVPRQSSPPKQMYTRYSASTVDLSRYRQQRSLIREYELSQERSKRYEEARHLADLTLLNKNDVDYFSKYRKTAATAATSGCQATKYSHVNGSSLRERSPLQNLAYQQSPPRPYRSDLYSNSLSAAQSASKLVA